jgi:hypothetical protein
MKWIAMLAVGLALGGCDPSPACDEGYRAELGSCIPLSKDAGVKDAGRGAKDAGRAARDASDDDAGSVAAGPVAAPDAGCASGPGHYEGFGDMCMHNSDCSSCAAPTCAGVLNMCSRINCQTSADACPPGWQCTDISAFSSDPSVTHICFKM